jgi:hypothetical protein
MVTISGICLSSATSAAFNGTPSSVTFDGQTGALRTNVPAGATTGSPRVITPCGSTLPGFGDTFTVTGGGGGSLPAPTNLQTFPAALGADLTWTASSANISGFKLERRMSIGAYQEIAVLPPGTRSYSDFPLSSSITYAYRIKAFNAGGESAYSNEASVRPLRF